MEIIYKKLDEIKPYANNPRKNDSAVDALAESIKKFGFKQPIVIDVNGEIVAGHTRLKAAKKLGLKEVPCILADDLTPEQVKAYRIADNRTGELSGWDFDLLESELSEITDIDIEALGFAELEPNFENLEELTSDDDDDEYLEFIKKFKPKKTTDDCFTPPLVYEAVKDWAINEYGIPDDAEIIRPYKIRTAPELAEAIDRAVEEGRERAPEMPAYDYPLEVVTAARLAKIAHVEFRVLPEHCHFTRQLDSQKETGAALYGSGYLIAEKAAAEKAAAKEIQVWELSPREREIIKKLGEAEGL